MTISLGIDVGTSAVKVVLIDENGVLGQADSPLETVRLRPGWSEQHPDSWLAATRSALAELRQNTGVLFGQVAAIGLSGQMHGSVLLDADDRPLRPAILWNDFRASLEAQAIERNCPDLASIAGVMCVASFVAPKIFWLRKHEPDIIDRVSKILLPKDYLRFWLTGEFATDVVDASGAWFLDQRKRQWSATILDRLEIDLTSLPIVLESLAVSGSLRSAIAAELGLRAGIPVVAGAGDAGAGGLGLGVTEDGEAFISLGTSAQFFVVTKEYRPSIPTLIHAFAYAVPDRWFQMAAMLNGASALAWWSTICGPDPGALIESASTKSISQNDPLFLPYLAGERTPHNDPTARGTFLDLSVSADRETMTRAVLEGVAFCLADAQLAMREAGTEINRLGFTGGGSRSRLWAQLVADVLNVGIIRYRGSEVGPALGAARLAMTALNFSATDVFRKPDVMDECEPSADRHSLEQSRLARWRRAYQALRGSDETET